MLPIYAIAAELLAGLDRETRIVLTAPTGSGKTTQVPQILHKSGRFAGEVVILQPRRLAARLVAQRIAQEMQSRVGEVVGYQTRHDSQVSAATRIRFLTEGLFLRRLQTNPTLDGVSIVVLDEFHERNLATDTSIALVKRLQETRRPDLRMVVMSATLEVERVREYLGCPALETHGRLFPVEVKHLTPRSSAGNKSSVGKFDNRVGPGVWDVAAEAVAAIVAGGAPGDVLVFMPGGYEIRRTIESLERARVGETLAVFPLYSELPAKEQDLALAPAPHRKVIVATNVAETSITIEGVRHVVDSGLARINRFDPKRGINVLAVEPISRASADQRAGRAGRTAPGTCTRLWPESDHRHRPGHSTPEVLRLDLAEVTLQLYAYGVDDVAAFPWLEKPDEAALAQAHRTLVELGAVTPPPHRLTDVGRRMARLPMHPRLSRMLMAASDRNGLGRAALWAALISERDILQRGGERSFAEDLGKDFPQSDFVVLERALAFAKSASYDAGRCAAKGVNGNAAREVEKTRRLYLDAAREAGLPAPSPREDDSIENLGRALLVAFPDHLSMRRNAGNLAAAVVGGRRGQLDPDTVATHVGLLLPVEIREIGAGGAKSGDVKTVLSLITEVAPEWVRDVHPQRVIEAAETTFNDEAKAVEARRVVRFDDLVIEENLLHESRVNPSAAAEILAAEVIAGRLKLEQWDDSVEQWIARVRCVAAWFPERGLITYSDDELRLVVEELVDGAIRYKDIRGRPVLGVIRNALSWDDQQFVERMAPERVPLPRGWKMRIEYAPGAAPRGRGRIQDFFGVAETPRIAGGRVRLLLELLAPSQRPVQLTEDLASFWKNLYPTLRKELGRRYPRHDWREDPLGERV